MWYEWLVECPIEARSFISTQSKHSLSLSHTHTKHTIAFKKNWFRWNCRLFIGFRARYPCCQFESELWKYIYLVCGNDWIIIICLKHCLFWLHTLLLIISMAFERRRHNFQKRSFLASVCILPFAPRVGPVSVYLFFFLAMVVSIFLFCICLFHFIVVPFLDFIYAHNSIEFIACVHSLCVCDM